MARVRRPRGATLGNYIILDLLSESPRSSIYRAYEPDEHRRVAIKFVTPASGISDVLDRAQAIAGVDHPNIAETIEVGTADDEVFQVMELIDGRTLERWLGRTQRRWTDTVQKVMHAGRGLAAAHAAGVAHGDFSLSEAMLDERGRVRVIGFTLEPGWAPLIPGHLDDVRPARLVPNVRADQLALCRAAWNGLFRGPPAILRKRDTGAGARTQIRMPRPWQADVPDAVAHILRRGISGNDPWPSLDALLDDLEHPGRRA